MTKRAALARALALDPEILFLDEPTPGLDPIAADAFDELLLTLKASLDLTAMMITHDPAAPNAIRASARNPHGLISVKDASGHCSKL